MTNFKEIKFYFEGMFSSKWTKTNVHYGGQDFDATGIDEWVNPTYSPENSRKLSLSDGVDVINGVLYIPCWSTNDVKVMALSDEVTKFIEDNIEYPHTVTRVNVIDHGWEKSNKAFVILAISIKSQFRNC